jgi:hypothetical protein
VIDVTDVTDVTGIFAFDGLAVESSVLAVGR